MNDTNNEIIQKYNRNFQGSSNSHTILKEKWLSKSARREDEVTYNNKSIEVKV